MVINMLITTILKQKNKL